MDALSSIFTWLSDHEAGISAVAAILAIAVILFAGFRWLLLRGTAGTPEKLLVRPGRRTILIAAAAALLLALVGVIAWLLWPDEPNESDTDLPPNELKEPDCILLPLLLFEEPKLLWPITRE